MIARTWRCQSPVALADDYYHYLTGTIFASLARIDGHRGAYLLRRAVGEQVEFVAVTFWDSYEAIKQYAGDTVDIAVVKPEAQAMLSDYDTFVHHYTVAHDTMTGMGM